MHRRYEIFVSSTFRDLEEKRRIVYEEISRQRHIPVGMEIFEPGFRPAWNKIEPVIRSADYYVLIVGSSYGTVEPESRVSYTEREFNFAQELKKPTLVFLMSDASYARAQAGVGDTDSALGERLNAFRNRLKESYVVYWDDTNFREVVASKLGQWVTHNAQPGGWVQASVYEIADTQKEVYGYLLNRLNPFPDLQLTFSFVHGLRQQLTSMTDVLYALDSLIKHYVRRCVTPDIRVYFAYRLPESVEVSPMLHPAHDLPFEAHYRLGMSTSKEGKWMEGLPIGRDSNIDRVYRQRTVCRVPNAHISFVSHDGANEPVEDEGSVIGTPVLYSVDECVGVVGLSSPEEDVVTQGIYLRLADEISTLFSALVYAYAQKYRIDPPADGVAEQLRTEIAEHFRGQLPAL